MSDIHQKVNNVLHAPLRACFTSGDAHISTTQPETGRETKPVSSGFIHKIQDQVLEKKTFLKGNELSGLYQLLTT